MPTVTVHEEICVRFHAEYGNQRDCKLEAVQHAAANLQKRNIDRDKKIVHEEVIRIFSLIPAQATRCRNRHREFHVEQEDLYRSFAEFLKLVASLRMRRSIMHRVRIRREEHQEEEKMKKTLLSWI